MNSKKLNKLLYQDLKSDIYCLSHDQYYQKAHALRLDYFNEREPVIKILCGIEALTPIKSITIEMIPLSMLPCPVKDIQHEG